MTRDEALRWYREGYTAGLAEGKRQHQADDLAADVYDHLSAVDNHMAAVATFHGQRRADEQAVIGALIAEVVDLLARAMLGDPCVREGNAA